MIGGDVRIAGRPVGIEFQRGTAYVEQQDVHEWTTTVREALRFSAYLRQPHEIPQLEKDDYVEEIIQLLEMEDIADAMIGFPVSTGSCFYISQGLTLPAGLWSWCRSSQASHYRR